MPGRKLKASASWSSPASSPAFDPAVSRDVDFSGFGGAGPLWPSGEPWSGASRPHICFVAPEAWPVVSGSPDIGVIGGAEVQQSILARLFVRAGYRVSFICLDYGQPPRVELDGISVFKAHRPDAGIPVLRFIHPRLTSIWQAMKRVNADIYYQRSAAMLTAVVAAFCRRHGKHSIYAGASDSDFLPGQQSIRFARDRWLFEWGIASVDRLVVQNAAQQRTCRENYGRESVVIPSCYELPKDARPGSGRNVLWVANINRDKRPEMFLAIARRLPQYRFVMIGGAGGDFRGDRNYFESIRAEALALPNVEFTGFLPLARAEAYFDRAAVLVNTSETEGVPNTFLQAWSRGVPTVASVDTGARIRGEPAYRIVHSVEAAAREIDRLLADNAHWQVWSERCQEYFDHNNSLSTALTHYERVFAELVPGAAGCPG